ncbi:probable serine/threonine-protein kinase PIX13 [Impatiens glandulifera]|uniref:probable serine/threonine-protein kinase PIX13 n=1 Tax=Impatiens glandulifera TaxID=253017 RepID=UPI001FB15171|nr:probable serine/threonine-protein kinase PIX13 [Impatiens glandulifera]
MGNWLCHSQTIVTDLINTSENTTTRASAYTSGGGGGVSNGESTNTSNNGDHNPMNEEIRQLKVYSFADMINATKNFRSDSTLGIGGFGTVYKGWLDQYTLLPSSKFGTGIMVAIKKLNQQSTQGFREWESEVNILGRLSHPNLVKLLGYCWEDKELLLVYEFVVKGSLENHLFRRIRGNSLSIEPLSWDTRLNIAIGAARGLGFLHGLDEKIIYRDFKASNILLDEDYNAKISDFGLAKLGPSGGASHVSTRVMGTSGYAAPEYIATGHLYVKSDVYGFGVVLLEILTGNRAIDNRRPNGQKNLVEWLRPSLGSTKKLKSIIDPGIQGQYRTRDASQVAKLILQCLETDPRKRPSMKEVVEALEQIRAV